MKSLRHRLIGLAIAAALGGALPATTTAAVFYLSKVTARNIVVQRVSKGPPFSPTVRYWVEAAPACFRYSSVRVSCRFWAEYRQTAGGVGRCYGDMMVTLTSRAQPRAYATRGVDVQCGPA
jgi:hypothetical protein